MNTNNSSTHANITASHANTETTTVRVHSLTDAGPRVLLIELRATDGELPAWSAGSHIDLHLGPLIRQYSLLGNPKDRDRWLIAVLKERDSRGGSACIHDQLRVGHTFEVVGPRNTFPLDEESLALQTTQEGAGKALLLAGGIGITPLAGMAEALHANGSPFELHLYSEGSSPLAERMDSRPWSDAVTYHDTQANPGDSLRSASSLPTPHTPGSHVYICGPVGFIDRCVELASATGWPEDSIHVERFTLAEPLDVTGESFEVIAKSTGETMTVGEDQTIADVLVSNGYSVELSCEMGICGSCITSVLEGTPDHRDEVQSPAEHASNELINVCCSRSKTPSLTLDI